MRNSVEDYINSAGLQPGDRLAPERELADLLKLPRTKVRRHMEELVGKGVITRHVGRGTFLAGGDNEQQHGKTRPAQSPTFGTYPAEVFETRLIVEPQIARLAAMRASAEKISEMRKTLEKCRNADTLAKFEKYDAAFHNLLVASANNHLVSVIYEAISSVRSGKIWGRMKEMALTPELMQKYSDHHDAVLQAIADRDANAAEQRMREHILESRKNLLEL